MYHAVTCLYCSLETCYRGEPHTVSCYSCHREIHETPVPVGVVHYREWLEDKRYVLSTLLGEILAALPADAVALREKLILYKGLL